MKEQPALNLNGQKNQNAQKNLYEVAAKQLHDGHFQKIRESEHESESQPSSRYSVGIVQ